MVFRSWSLTMEFCRSLPTEILKTTRCAESLSFVSIEWFRIVSLSPRVKEPNSEVKKLINVRTWTTESPVYLSLPIVFLHIYNVCEGHGYTALALKNIRLDMSGWGSWSIGNCARKLDFDIRTSDSQQQQQRKQQEKEKRIVDFAVPADHRVKLKEIELRGCLYLARQPKKTVEHESDGDTNCKWRTWYSHQRIGTWTWKLEEEYRASKLRQCWDQPKYWEKSWKLKKTYCHSNSSGKPFANADVKNSQMCLYIFYNFIFSIYFLL